MSIALQYRYVLTFKGFQQWAIVHDHYLSQMPMTTEKGRTLFITGFQVNIETGDCVVQGYSDTYIHFRDDVLFEGMKPHRIDVSIYDRQPDKDQLYEMCQWAYDAKTQEEFRRKFL